MTSRALSPAFDSSGTEIDGWPKFNGGWGLFSPTVGDLDGDGTTEVVQHTREGYAFVWDTPGDAAAGREWWRYRHDDQNTANYGLGRR